VKKVELINDYPQFKKGLKCYIIKEINFLNRKSFELQIEGTERKFTVTEEELKNEFVPC
jgi:hypothetical protein